MKPVDQSAHDREMAAHDDVKRVPEIPRNHCPSSAKYADQRASRFIIASTRLYAPFQPAVQVVTEHPRYRCHRLRNEPSRLSDCARTAWLLDWLFPNTSYGI